MYDEDLVNDSLEACKNLVSIKDGTTAGELFESFASLQKEKSGHVWEDVLDGLNNSEDWYPFDNTQDGSPDDGFIIFDYTASKDSKARSPLSIIHFAILAVSCIAIAFLLAAFINAFVAHQTTIEGESMEPSLQDNDSVIIQKLSYYWKDPKRYDVIVFPVPEEDGTDSGVYYIKRVIGLPGEVVQIIDGEVYIDGNKLDGDNYSDEEITDPGIAEMPVQLAEDEYFVLGDNRNMSTDSRYKYVGMVKRKDIEGEAWCCIWPFSHIKKLS